MKGLFRGRRGATVTSRLAIVAWAMVAGCDGWPTGHACTFDVVPAIVVEIYDGDTGEPAAYAAVGYVQDGDYTDALTPYSGLDSRMVSRRAADERPGKYDVFVSHEGYADWLRPDVRVGKGSCHVKTVRLRADLEPVP